MENYRNWPNLKRDNCTYIVGDVAFEYNDEIYSSGENGDRACIPTKIFNDFDQAYNYWLEYEKLRHIKDELRTYCYGISDIAVRQDALDDFLCANGFSDPINTYISTWDPLSKSYKVIRRTQLLEGQDNRLQHIIDCAAESDIRKDWTNAQWDEYLTYFRLRFSIITSIPK